jgi:glycosyltransferase involved in cell wall biosynthesis
MRIALCADGRSPHTQRWANGVCERGHDVALVWVKSEFTSSDLSSFRPSISHHVLDRPDRRRLWKLPLVGLEARRLAAELQPDLVHGLFLTGYGWMADDTGIRPLVLSALGSDVLDLDPRSSGTTVDRLSARYVARRTHSAVAASDLVLTDSVSLADDLHRKVPGTEIRIIRFGVEIRDTAPGARGRWRARLGVDEDAFVLLSSRLVRPQYNIDTIVRALPAIRHRCPGAVLVLKELPRFSDPEYRQSCLQLADSLGVGDSVRVLGELDRGDLLELYAAADVYVSVPSTDGTAVSVLEAMAAGVAVVATDAPGIDPTILSGGDSAVLVPVRDAGSLATAVAELGVDPARRQRLAERALYVVRRHADFNRELDRAVHLYEELLAAAPRAIGEVGRAHPG